MTRTKIVVCASALIAAGAIYSAVYPEWLYGQTRMQRWYENHETARKRFWTEDFEHCTKWSRDRKFARELLGGDWGYVGDRMWLSDMRQCLRANLWTDASITELDTKKELGSDPKEQAIEQPAFGWWLVETWPPGALNDKDVKPFDSFGQLYNTRPECDRAAIRAGASELVAWYKEHGGFQLTFRCEPEERRRPSDTVVPPRGAKAK
jgi:hypothetical protein